MNLGAAGGYALASAPHRPSLPTTRSVTATFTLVSRRSHAVRRRMLATLLLVAPVAALAQGALGAPRAVVAGETRTLQLGAGRTLRLEVRLPRSYGKGAHRYPVLFVLDPSWNLDHAAATARFLAANTKMPEMIVVGVDGGDRERDFTPTAGGGAATSGHAREFLDAMATQVVPAIDRAYRTAPMRVLVGHSLAGLFAAWAFVERPALFARVVALDPSLWWDEGAIATDIARRVTARRERGVLAIAEGQRQAESRRVADAATARVQVPILSVSGESHLSMPLRGLYDALLVAFADYAPLMRRDEELANPDTLVAQYRALSAVYGYDVAPPEAALLEIVQRSLNRRNGADAIRAGELATQRYPESAEARAELATARRVAPTLPVIPPPPASNDVSDPLAARLLGAWDAFTHVDPGEDMRSTVTFTRRGGTLACSRVTRGVAMDGGDFRQTCLAVLVRGDSVEIWFRNNGGGYLVTLATVQADGTVTGTEAPRHLQIPPGMTMPDIRVTVQMTRARGGS